MRFSKDHFNFVFIWLLGFGISQSSLFAQPVIKNLTVIPQQYDSRKAYNLEKIKRDYLQKTTLSDTIPLPFFDDFSRTDLSWAPSPFRFGLPIHALQFFGSKNGFGFGAQQLVVKTDNRGGIWSASVNPGQPDILSVSFPGQNPSGWACGSKGFLAQTNDSGKTWIPKNSPALETTLLDISFQNSQQGLLVDTLGRLFYTSNGGQTWTQSTSPGMDAFRVRCVGWNANGQPIAGGDSSKIAFSPDGGANWTIQKQANRGPIAFRKIRFFGSNIGFAIGDSGLLYKTFNSGLNWVSAVSKSKSTFYDIGFAFSINEKLGWIVGKTGALLATQDGGNSWAQIRSGTKEDLLCVSMMNEYRGWIGTRSGALIQVVIDPSRPESKWWERNSGVYINNNYCVNPITFGVATFDGTNAEGLPYSSEVNRTGGCDTLTSVHLDLSNTQNQFLNLSFYWQPGSYISQLLPEFNDSLVVQFKSPHDKWISVWNKAGTQDQIVTPFRFAAIPLADSLKYEGFQFRFISYGLRNGNFDLWSIDYVRLDNVHNLADSSALDLALTQNPTRLLKEFHAYPLDQFNEQNAAGGSFLSDAISGEAINLNAAGLFNNISGKFRITSDRKGETLAEAPNSSVNGFGLIPTKNTRGSLSIPRQEFIPLPFLPEATTLRYGFILDSDPEFNLFSNNDTLFSKLNLSTYMAYDDGSAEAAKYVLGTGNRGAVRFFLPRTDTLTDIALYFPRTPATETQEIIFTLILYKDIDVANNIETPIFRFPVTLPPSGDSLNRFNYFSMRLRPLLQRTLEGGKYFYIGWENTVVDNNNEVTLGIDLNSSSPGNFFYTISGQWKADTSDSYPIMIRPVFGEETPTPVKQNLSQPKSPFFPNPARNELINKESFSDLQIFNNLGQLVLAESNPEGKNRLEIQLNPGLYFLNWTEKNGRRVNQKIIVEH